MVREFLTGMLVGFFTVLVITALMFAAVGAAAYYFKITL